MPKNDTYSLKDRIISGIIGGILGGILGVITALLFY